MLRPAVQLHVEPFFHRCNCSYCTYYTIIQGSNRLFEWAFEIGAVLRTVLLVRSMDGAQAAIQSFVKFCVARCAEFCTARTVGFLFALFPPRQQRHGRFARRP